MYHMKACVVYGTVARNSTDAWGHNILLIPSNKLLGNSMTAWKEGDNTHLLRLFPISFVLSSVVSPTHLPLLSHSSHISHHFIQWPNRRGGHPRRVTLPQSRWLAMWKRRLKNHHQNLMRRRRISSQKLSSSGLLCLAFTSLYFW